MSMDLPRGAPAPHPARRAGVARGVVLLTLVAAIAFTGGMLFADTTDSPHNDKAFQTFWQSWDILDREFYYGSPSNEDLIRSAIQGLLRAAGDPYTFYVPPAEAVYDRQQTAGEFGGIGADVALDTSGNLVIINPYSGFPASEAGLLPQDQILEVDGRSLKGMSVGEAAGLLRGEIGAEVTLTVYRPAEDRQFEVTLTRARVELPTVNARMIGEIGYARLFNFNSNATSLLEEALRGQLERGATVFVLDLRDNPGGLLDQAVGVSDLFLGGGVVVQQRTRSGRETVYRSDDGDIGEDVPLVVLVNAGSASASEVVAGALRDRGRAALLGQTTYGKGSVQHVHTLADDAQVHVTFALWFTPAGSAIQGEGLAPDVEIEPPVEIDPGEDPVLDRALDYVRDNLLPDAQDGG
ncbi:MAG: S41 family peptidase [Anaerolineae bacterium]|nr:S41 family peptidase [Anaerolineae bacterium]